MRAGRRSSLMRACVHLVTRSESVFWNLGLVAAMLALRGGGAIAGEPGASTSIDRRHQGAAHRRAGTSSEDRARRETDGRAQQRAQRRRQRHDDRRGNATTSIGINSPDERRRQLQTKHRRCLGDQHRRQLRHGHRGRRRSPRAAAPPRWPSGTTESRRRHEPRCRRRRDPRRRRLCDVSVVSRTRASIPAARSVTAAGHNLVLRSLGSAITDTVELRSSTRRSCSRANGEVEIWARRSPSSRRATSC